MELRRRHPSGSGRPFARPSAGLIGSLLILLFCGAASADVLILKSGRKVAGDVQDKETHYLVRVEGEELTFTKDEVDRWCKSPKDLLGDAPALVEDAKKLYLAAVDLKDDKAAEAMFREALPKVTKAREAYAEARELFPDGYPELDVALVNIMKLMRLIRERMGSQLARAPPPIKPKGVAPLDAPPPAEQRPEPKPEPAKPEPPKPEVPGPEPSKPEPRAESPLGERIVAALAVATSAEKRASPEEREKARDLLGPRGRDRSPILSFATALQTFLCRDDKDWRLLSDRLDVKGQGFEQSYAGKLVRRGETAWSFFSERREVRLRKAPDGWKVTPPGGTEFAALDVRIQENLKSDALAPLQEYLTLHGLIAVNGFTPAQHLAEARFLLERTKAMRAKDPTSPIDVLLLFAAAHLDVLLAVPAPDPAVFDVVKAAGWQKADFGMVVGTADGLAIDAYHRWLAVGLYDMAIVEFLANYAQATDLGVRYVFGMLYLFRALAVNRYYERAYLHFEKMAQTAPSVRVREHLQALARSIRAGAVCKACQGTHEVRCTVCHGKMKADFQCVPCGGKGQLQTVRGLRPCRSCKGAGTFRNIDCVKCKGTGKLTCKAKGCARAVPKPTIDAFCEALECSLCGGRGSLFDHVALPCTECAGVGLFLLPKSDPAKTIK